MICLRNEVEGQETNPLHVSPNCLCNVVPPRTGAISCILCTTEHAGIVKELVRTTMMIDSNSKGEVQEGLTKLKVFLQWLLNGPVLEVVILLLS